MASSLSSEPIFKKSTNIYFFGVWKYYVIGDCGDLPFTLSLSLIDETSLPGGSPIFFSFHDILKGKARESRGSNEENDRREARGVDLREREGERQTDKNTRKACGNSSRLERVDDLAPSKHFPSSSRPRQPETIFFRPSDGTFHFLRTSVVFFLINETAFSM